MSRIAVALAVLTTLLPTVAAAQYRAEPFVDAMQAGNRTTNPRLDEMSAGESRWANGLWVGALAGAALGGLLGTAFCGDSDVEIDCAGPLVRGVLFGSIAGAAIGGVIGGLVPREPRR